MTPDEIIKMAREAGWKEIPEYSTVDHLRFFGSYNILERFAALVAAREREECAKVCEQAADDEFYMGRQYADAIRARLDQ